MIAPDSKVQGTKTPAIKPIHRLTRPVFPRYSLTVLLFTPALGAGCLCSNRGDPAESNNRVAAEPSSLEYNLYSAPFLLTPSIFR